MTNLIIIFSLAPCFSAGIEINDQNQNSRGFSPLLKGRKRSPAIKVKNVHQRKIPRPLQQVGALLDTLSSKDDQLWPYESWPRMKFDKPLQVGANGGHGPIRYFVEAYQPGKSIRFRFTAPKGFEGYHEFEVNEIDSSHAMLKHSLAMNATGLAILSWALAYRPLHDALLEDSLEKAEKSLGVSAERTGWSGWVKSLRWILGKFVQRKPSS
jgi:hypothetical protein